MCDNAGMEGDLQVKMFVRSLKGIAFELYTDLKVEFIDSLEHLKDEFLNSSIVVDALLAWLSRQTLDDGRWTCCRLYKPLKCVKPWVKGSHKWILSCRGMHRRHELAALIHSQRHQTYKLSVIDYACSWHGKNYKCACKELCFCWKGVQELTWRNNGYRHQRSLVKISAKSKCD